MELLGVPLCDIVIRGFTVKVLFKGLHHCYKGTPLWNCYEGVSPQKERTARQERWMLK